MDVEAGSAPEDPAKQGRSFPPPFLLVGGRWLQRCLFAVAAVCLGIVAWALADRQIFEIRQGSRLDAALRQRHLHPGWPSRQATSSDRLDTFRKPAQPNAMQQGRPLPPPEGTVLGRIEIARTGVSALVLEGTSDETLRRGVGHIPGSSPPEGPGNLALAGHRDSFFRGLAEIRAGDIVSLATLEGDFRYRIDWTRVVSPDETDVLDPVGSPVLTLVTCYPFHYIGAAPQRFIVRAHRLENQPSTRATH